MALCFPHLEVAPVNTVFNCFLVTVCLGCYCGIHVRPFGALGHWCLQSFRLIGSCLQIQFAVNCLVRVRRRMRRLRWKNWELCQDYGTVLYRFRQMLDSSHGGPTLWSWAYFKSYVQEVVLSIIKQCTYNAPLAVTDSTEALARENSRARDCVIAEVVATKCISNAWTVRIYHEKSLLDVDRVARLVTLNEPRDAHSRRRRLASTTRDFDLCAFRVELRDTSRIRVMDRQLLWSQ